MASQEMPAKAMKGNDLSLWNWRRGDLLLDRYLLDEVRNEEIWRVIRASDRDNNTTVLLKTFINDYCWDNEAFVRFKTISEDWVALGKHPGVLQAFSVNEMDGMPFIVLEYPGDLVLSDMVGKLSREKTLDYALQFSSTMDCLYKTHGLLHRDITPSTMHLTEGGALKVSGFGLIKVFDSLELPDRIRNEKSIFAYSSRLTRTGYGLGLPLYMSREMEGNRLHKDIRSDIFSFGVVLFEMALAKEPRGSRDWRELMQRLYDHLHKSDYKTEKLFEGLILYPGLQEILSRCMARNIEDRYPDFASLTAALSELYRNSIGEEWRAAEAPVPEVSEVAMPAEAPVPEVSEVAMPVEDVPEEESLSEENEWARKGRAFRRSENYTEALKCYVAALEDEPDNQVFWTARGEILCSLKRYNEAIKCFSRALKKDPSNREVWLFLGNALSTMGRNSDAIECFNKALSLDPEDPFTLRRKGMALDLLGSHRDAIACYDEALSREPQSFDTLKQKTFSLFTLNLFSDTLNCLEEALKIREDDGELWTCKGKVLLRLSRRDEALAAFETALKYDGHLAEAWCSQGILQALLRRHNEAINSYNRALVERPRYEDAWNHKGESLNVLGRSAEALQCFNIVLDINPRYTEAWTNKGMILSKSGKLDEAMECFSKALSINPASTQAMNAIAHLGSGY